MTDLLKNLLLNLLRVRTDLCITAESDTVASHIHAKNASYSSSDTTGDMLTTPRDKVKETIVIKVKAEHIFLYNI